MIRISGSAATIYPILAAEMSFDGDSVSHYYSAVSGSLPALRALTRGFPSALVGYSGGVDSALLAVVLRQELGGERMLAAVGRSPSYPAAEWATARAVAQRFEVPLVELDTHELDDPRYLANPTNRCFFCKKELWRRLIPEAQARGLAVVCDGTNADDLGEHRPGHAAGVAAGVRSPLADVGFTKADVRRAARALGLPIWDAPAAVCRVEPSSPRARSSVGRHDAAAGAGAPRELGPRRRHPPDAQVSRRGGGRAGAGGRGRARAGGSGSARPAPRAGGLRRVSRLPPAARGVGRDRTGAGARDPAASGW